MGADVLICDEHLLFGEALAETLRGSGVDPIVTSGAADALEAFARQPASRVVMGIRLSRSAVANTTRKIRAGWPSTRIICVGVDEGEETGAWLDAGADLVLSRKLSLDELVLTVLWTPRMDESPRPGATPASGRTPRATGPLAARFLTDREREVLRLLVCAESTREISHRLGISVATTRGYIQSTFVKLGVHSRVEAVTYAVRHSLVDLTTVRAGRDLSAGAPPDRLTIPA
jgi:two-component system nitrate/nitrite response regulator NarL